MNNLVIKIIICIIPITILHSLLLHLSGDKQLRMFVANSGCFLTAIALPIYLVITDIWFFKNTKTHYTIFLINAVISFFVIWCSGYFQLQAWHIRNENLKIDSETKEVINFTRAIGYFIYFVGQILLFRKLKFVNISN